MLCSWGDSRTLGGPPWEWGPLDPELTDICTAGTDNLRC